MPHSLTFGGKTYYTPSAPTAVNDSAMNPGANATGNAIAILGVSTGGQPGKAITFTSGAAAAATLLDGELLIATQSAFAPSTDLDGNGTVYALRVGAQTPGTVTLKDASGNAAIVLTTTQYGTIANASKVMVQTGTDNGYELSVGTSGGTTYTQDDVYRPVFTASYSGGGTSPEITISDTSVSLVINGAAAGSIDLTVHSTLASLVDAISMISGFTATLVPGNENGIALAQLDHVTSLALTNGTPFTVTANTQAQIDWFNSPAAGGLFTAARAAGGGLPAAVSGWATAAGGTAPAPVITDWTNALVALQAVDVQHIAILSSNPAIWAAAEAHCAFMSSQGQKERRFYTGTALGTSLAVAQTQAASINSGRGELVWPGYEGYDINGNLTTYAPYMSAALVAAGFASLSPGQSMTGVSLDVVGLETTVNAPTDTDPLIKNGVTPLMVDETGAVVVARAVSTYLTSNAYDQVEVSCGIATDYTTRYVRDYVKKRFGSQGKNGQGVGPLTLSGVISDAETALNFCAKPAPQGPGTIVGDANSPPWSNLSGTATGDTVTLAYQISPVIPLNFIPQDANVVPYSGTVTVSSSFSSTGSSS